MQPIRARRSHFTALAALAVAVSVLVPAASAPSAAGPGADSATDVVVADPEAACARIEGLTIPRWRIGTARMMRNDATVTRAEYHHASAAVLTPDGTPADNAGVSSAVVTPAKPDFCQLTGSIAPVTEGAQPIGFQVNLPTEWNGSSAQFGGGGFNGVLRDATGYISINTNSGEVLTPLMRGYLTLSTDSGHLTTASPRFDSQDPVERADARFDFALNEEMFRNFATDAYKKVKDVGEIVAKKYYGKRPASWLWFGGSEGGREGLLMAQRFPKEFDGIFVRNPVIGWTGLFSNFIETLQAVERDNKAGAFTQEDIDLLARTSSATCDSADGIADAVLSNYGGCQAEVHKAVSALRCTGDPIPGACFTPAQIEVIDTVYRPLDLGFTLPSGLDHYPAFLFGGEAWSLKDKIGNDPSIDYGETGYPNYLYYAAGAAKFVFAQDASLDVVNDFDRAELQERLAAVSSMMDTLDPDLSAFKRHGGKLIVLECTSDYAQSAAMGMEYYDSVTSQLGQSSVDQFMRLYVSPGTDHGCAGTIDPATLDSEGKTPYGAATSEGSRDGVPRNVDWVDVLENWVQEGSAPGDAVVATTNEPAPPFSVLAAKPICTYPLYPRFTGIDASAASSYTCQQ